MPPPQPPPLQPGGSVGDDAVERLDDAVAQPSDHVVVVYAVASREDAERPSPPHVDPARGFELVADDLPDVTPTVRNPTSPVLTGDVVQRFVQHRIVVVRAPYRVRLPVPVLQVAARYSSVSIAERSANSKNQRALELVPPNRWCSRS
jgi:hypothetical protein